jgi:small GTP-binding protein
MDLCGERETLKVVARINERIAEKDGIAIYNFTSWPYKENIQYRIKRLFDGIVEIDAVTEVAYSGQKYRLEKVGWNGQTGKSVLFKVFRPGGFKLYIPKVMVIGPFGSGKTSFMKILCDRHTSVDRLGSTIAVEHGTIDRTEYRAEVFGIPGQERFSPLAQKMEGTATGALLIVDATNPDSFSEANTILKRLLERHIPVVIAANKQDVSGALAPSSIQQQLGTSNIPVAATTATSGEGVFESFELLVEQIIEGESHVK